VPAPLRLVAALLATLPLACAAPRRPDREPATTQHEAPARERPRLVVIVVVDQMRGDYLDRFAHLFDDGLARLREGGALFVDGRIAHAVTMTSPGHASVVTGTHPRQHGVIQNEWFDRNARAPVYAAADPNAPILGPAGELAGLEGRSPASLLRPALGDWLKDASPTSEVHAIAFKDRAAVLLGGQRPDSVHWYEPTLPGYVSSRHYEAALPPWVAAFDASPAIDAELGAPWARALPADRYAFVGDDRVPTEGDGVDTTFPHRLGDDPSSYHKGLGTSPRGDALTLALATEALAGESLGRDDAPDLLLISLSGADLVGHAFGPESHELVDYYVHLDRRLGDFMRRLDADHGDRYILVLTSDHGVASLPEIAAARGESAERVLAADFEAAVAATLATVAAELAPPGADAPPAKIAFTAFNEAIWLDLDHLPAGVDPPALRAAAAAALRQLPFVEEAYTYDDLAGDHRDPARPLLERFRLGFVADRTPDIQLQGPPGWLVNNRPRGTSHGSPHGYDTQVPIVFYGADVRPGRRFEAARTVDIAPTIAELLGLTPPPGIDGRSLTPLLR